MTTMAETARPLASTMICSRCRSENFGDLKFCRFCGCRLRVPPPVESFVRPGEAARPTPSPFIPVDVELAKRYVAQGKHHFAVGELDAAAECFRRALDAAPGHPQLIGFLRRVGELKARLAQQTGGARPSASAPEAARPVQAPSGPPALRVLPSGDARGARRPAADVAATGPGARVISLRRPPALSVVPTTATAVGLAASSDDVAPSGVPAPVSPAAGGTAPVGLPSSPPPLRVVAAAGSLRADPGAELPSAAAGRTSSSLAERRTGARVLVADRPLSPALLMDRASGLEAWNETVAGVMVVAGLLAFGWILMFW